MTLKLLPRSTEPWRLPIRRRHAPAETQDYRDFRPCLRWEFGFSCAFCLLHEADLSEHGTEGWGLMWIEHAAPRSKAPERSNDYANCFYSCRFCNEARGAEPVDDEQHRQLLQPCRDVWKDHFERIGDEIRVRGDDPDAVYTLETYDLNDRRKVRMRGKRSRTIGECLDALTGSRPLHDRLLKRALDTGDPTLVDDALSAREYFLRAWKDLERFVPIPEDASRTCTCGNTAHHSLPEVLEEQTIEVDTSGFS